MAKTQLLRSPVGSAGFTVLKEPRAYKESAKKFYTLQLILNNKDGMEFLQKLEEEAGKLHAIEVEIQKAKGKPTRFAKPGIMVTDLPDGGMRFTFKREESLGHPALVNKDNKPHDGFVKSGAPVEVLFEMQSYILPGNVSMGVKLVLAAVRVLEAEVKVEDVLAAFGDAPQVEGKAATVDLF